MTAQQHASKAGAQEPTAAGADDPTATVVVVDDTPANVTLLERLLARVEGIEVHGFTDPRAALDHCAKLLPDLMLLDLHMPGLDGFEVMESLREMVPDNGFLPVLVLTADAATVVKERALAAGAKDFLAKPFDRTEVLLRVANLLETRALHRRLEERNADLQLALDTRMRAERAAAAEQERRQMRIEAALAPGSLTMVFQPVADLATGDLMGVEALARFSCEPARPPNEWFDEALSVGRDVELELAAVEAALAHLDELPDGIFMAVNVSPATALTEELGALLARHPAGRVVLELTEHARVRDYDALLASLGGLRSIGLRIAVDDTGAGYAGFQHLLRVRPDIVKLDTVLTSGIDNDPVRRSLGTALHSFATEIGATIIAEGIEKCDELATLRRIGIQWGQGYHLARPTALPVPGPRLHTDCPE